MDSRRAKTNAIIFRITGEESFEIMGRVYTDNNIGWRNLKGEENFK
ncbi:2812_t:CDS:1, partial [Funneliformis caledonium]